MSNKSKLRYLRHFCQIWSFVGTGDRHKSVWGLMTSNICIEMVFGSVKMIKCTNCETTFRTEELKQQPVPAGLFLRAVVCKRRQQTPLHRIWPDHGIGKANQGRFPGHVECRIGDKKRIKKGRLNLLPFGVPRIKGPYSSLMNYGF